MSTQTGYENKLALKRGRGGEVLYTDIFKIQLPDSFKSFKTTIKGLFDVISFPFVKYDLQDGDEVLIRENHQMMVFGDFIISGGDMVVDGELVVLDGEPGGGPTYRQYYGTDDDYTLTEQDSVVDLTANTKTFTLPTAVGIVNQTYTVKNSGAGVLTLDADGTETIDGSLTQALGTQYDYMTVQSNGANWIII